ncbi:hypothetical protein EV360DRAFT_75623 [Lentinula raphanica]|nr:hypothetical protein EV360DRAFT_75623 [Lentinula raphanica]
MFASCGIKYWASFLFNWIQRLEGNRRFKSSSMLLPPIMRATGRLETVQSDTDANELKDGDEHKDGDEIEDGNELEDGDEIEDSDELEDSDGLEDGDEQDVDDEPGTQTTETYNATQTTKWNDGELWTEKQKLCKTAYKCKLNMNIWALLETEVQAGPGSYVKPTAPPSSLYQNGHSSTTSRTLDGETRQTRDDLAHTLHCPHTTFPESFDVVAAKLDTTCTRFEGVSSNSEDTVTRICSANTPQRHALEEWIDENMTNVGPTQKYPDGVRGDANDVETVLTVYKTLLSELKQDYLAIPPPRNLFQLNGSIAVTFNTDENDKVLDLSDMSDLTDLSESESDTEGVGDSMMKTMNAGTKVDSGKVEDNGDVEQPLIWNRALRKMTWMRWSDLRQMSVLRRV